MLHSSPLYSLEEVDERLRRLSHEVRWSPDVEVRKELRSEIDFWLEVRHSIAPGAEL